MKKLPYIVLFTLITASCLTSCGKKENQKISENIPDEYIYTELQPGGGVVYVTEPAITEAISEHQELDAFENVAYYLDQYSGTYHDGLPLYINLDLKDCPYADNMHYHMEVLSADSRSIRVRVTADTDELIDWLNSRNCSFKTNVMDFEIPVSEIPTKMYTEQLYGDNKADIDKVMSEYLNDAIKQYNMKNESISDKVILKDIFLTIPKEDTVDVSKQYELSTNVSDGTGNKTNVYFMQNDAVYSIYQIFESESGYYLISCTPNFNDGKYEELCSIITNAEDGSETKENLDCEWLHTQKTGDSYIFATQEDCIKRIEEIFSDEELAKLIAIPK